MSKLLEGFSNDQIEQLAPHRGLSVGTKGAAKKLQQKGLEVLFTEDGWICEHEGKALICSDSTLFLEESYNDCNNR